MDKSFNKSDAYRTMLNMFRQVYGNAPILAMGDKTATGITLTIVGTEEKIPFDFFSSAMSSKLAGIEEGADVTDATNVAAAGAVMEADTTTALMQFVIDEDTMVSNLATKVPTQQSVKAYADSLVTGFSSGSSPTFVTVKLSGLTDGYIPKHTSDAVGLTDSPLIVNASGVGSGVTPAVRFHVGGTLATDIIRSDIGLDFNPVVRPTTTMVATPVAGAGLEIGVYWYRVSYITALGETILSDGITCTTTAGNQRVDLSSIPVSSDYRVTGRKLYRGVVGALWVSQLLATLNASDTTYSDTIADVSLGVGDNLLRANTTCNYITINRNRAMLPDLNITLFGFRAGYNLTLGGRITCLGAYAGLSNTVGSDSTYIGHQAGYYSTGIHNTLIGSLCGDGLTTATGCTAVGYAALSAVGGSQSTCFGALAGNRSTGANITAIGYAAGYTNTSGTSSVFLGYQAGYYETASNKLFIDNTARTNEADGRVKALVYGIFASTTAAQYLTINGHLNALESIDITTAGTTNANALTFGTDTNLYRSAANVLKTDDSLVVVGSIGIGTTDLSNATLSINSAGAGSKLWISNGTIAQYRAYFNLGASDQGVIGVADTTGVTKLALSAAGPSYINGGSLGIGTTAPKDTLEINGGLFVTGVATVSTGEGLGFQYTGATGLIYSYSFDTSWKPLYINASTLLLNTNGGTNIQLCSSTGKVGVGVAPASKFEVLGSRSDPTLTHDAESVALFGTDYVSLSLTTQTAAPYSLSLQVRHSIVDNISFPLCLNPIGGNVGIGTVSPYYLFTISSGYAKTDVTWRNVFMLGSNDGDTATDGLKILTKGGATQADRSIAIQTGDASTNAGSILIQGFGGNVGIGRAPEASYILDVQAASALYRITSSTGTNYAGAFFTNTAGNFFQGLESDTGGTVTTGSIAYSGLLIHQGNYPLQLGTNNTVKMTILGGGNVGIGTTSPDTTLQVVGDVKVGDDNTNYTNFDTTGHQTMVGTAKPWRDELADATNLKLQGGGISLSVTENAIEFLHTAAESDYMYCNIQLNHDKDLTCNIFPHIHWWAAEEDVIPNFEIWYRWQPNGGTKVTSWTKLACRTPAFSAPAAGVIKNQICGTASGIAVPVGTTISDIVQFRVIRNHSDTSSLHSGNDAYTAAAYVTAFDIHFQINSLGSTDEYTK